MSDRTSAGIFSGMFEYLAREPISDEALKFSRVLWEQQREYDFAPRQMECDKALIRLGLAKRGVSPEYPSDGEVTLYRDGHGWLS